VDPPSFHLYSKLDGEASGPRDNLEGARNRGHSSGTGRENELPLKASLDRRDPSRQRAGKLSGPAGLRKTPFPCSLAEGAKAGGSEGREGGF
jgi:hypothetical protein